MDYVNPKIDLICQHCTDGRIIPIRFRVCDEDGEQREFNIKSYREKSEYGLISFECNIVVHNRSKRVVIFTSSTSREGIWYIDKRSM